MPKSYIKPPIFSKLFNNFKNLLPNKKTIKSSLKSNSFIIISELLFLFGALGISAQGFFTLKSFFIMASAINGLAFLSTPPLALTVSCATFLFIYIFRVEQVGVFKKPFLKLLKHIADIEPIESYSSKTEKTYKNIEEIKLKYKLNLDKQEQINKDTPGSKNFIKQLLGNYVGGWVITFLALSQIGLRITVSVGVKMLGAHALFLLLGGLAGITVLPPYFLLISALMVTDGYVISNSQNLLEQYAKAKKDFGEDIKTVKDYENAAKTKKDIIKKHALPFISKAFKNISEQVTPEKHQKFNKDNTKKTEKTFSQKTWKGFRKTIVKSEWLIFWSGAIGASMTAFLAIDKFFNKMSKVPYLDKIIVLIPGPARTILALINSRYVLFVEHSVYRNHLSRLIKSFFGNGSSRSYQNKRIIKLTSKLCYLEKKIAEQKDINYTPSERQTPQELEHSESIKALRKIWLKRALYENKCTNKKGELLYSNNNNQDIKESYKKSYYYYLIAMPGSIALLTFRAMSNISTSAQGLDKAITALKIDKLILSLVVLKVAISILSLYGLIQLPVLLLGLATIGYIIKSANNIDKHWYNTLEKIFGVKFKFDNYQQKKHILALKQEIENKLQELASICNPKKLPEDFVEESLKVPKKEHTQKPIVNLKQLHLNKFINSADDELISELELSKAQHEENKAASPTAAGVVNF